MFSRAIHSDCIPKSRSGIGFLWRINSTHQNHIRKYSISNKIIQKIKTIQALIGHLWFTIRLFQHMDRCLDMIFVWIFCNLIDDFSFPWKHFRITTHVFFGIIKNPLRRSMVYLIIYIFFEVDIQWILFVTHIIFQLWCDSAKNSLRRSHPNMCIISGNRCKWKTTILALKSFVRLNRDSSSLNLRFNFESYQKK